MSFPEQINATTILNRVSRSLSHQGCQGYVVGGFIRDWLLDRQTNDIDIAVNGNALNIAQQVAKDLSGKFVLLDEINGIARVIAIEEEQHWHLDFSSFAGDIKSDLARRDFTVNAMAMEVEQFAPAVSQSPEYSEEAVNQPQFKLIDPFSGKKDLENKVLRAVSEQIFETDAARLLRAVRLAAELNFTIEPITESLIRQHCQALAKVPGERVREELLRLLSLPQAAHHVRYLDNLGLLSALVPELGESKGVEQPTVHFWDVFDHSLQTAAAVEFLMRESDWEYGNEDMLATVPWSDSIDQHLSQEVSKGSNHKVLLKLGGLLHDIAKPKTKSVDDTGRAHFLGHPKQGADMAALILERLRFSNKEINLVQSLVYHHLRPVQIANEGLPTKRAIYRYFRDTGDAGFDILLLALADYLATGGPLVNMQNWKEQCHLMNYILTEHEKQQATTLPVKLIDGHDLINIFGLTPGPVIGQLLALIHEARASGELTTKEEALALVHQELNKQQCDTRSGK
jgi:poly(A) polymerase